MSLRKSRLILFFLPLLLSAPFLNRARFVDDQFFIRIADWLKDHPTRPYDFAKEDQPGGALTQDQMLISIVNPLLHHYYLAGLMKLGGDREWFLRLGCVLLSCFSALFLFELARRWTAHPFEATALVFLTPAQWVSAHSLLIDPTMNFLFLAGLMLFVFAQEKESVPLAMASGGLWGLAFLTKYTAALFGPLAIGWWWVNKRDKTLGRLCLISLVVSCVPAIIYLVFTKVMYGQSHLSASMPIVMRSLSWGKLLVVSEFMTWATLVPLFAWLFMRTRPMILALVLTAMLGLTFVSPWGGLTVQQSLFLSVGLVSPILLVGLFYEVRLKWNRPGDAFFLIWIGAFVGMMSVVMPWVAARYLLIVVPAIVFIGVRLFELKRPETAQRGLWTMAGVLIIVSLGVAWGDYQQAAAGRSVVQELRERKLNEGERRFYFADGFTMDYLKSDGWRPCPDNSQLLPGDRILVSDVTMPLSWFLRRRIPIRLVADVEVSTHFPVKVMDSKAGAAFYASAWGPLPYAISFGPAERFRLFEVINTVDNY